MSGGFLWLEVEIKGWMKLGGCFVVEGVTRGLGFEKLAYPLRNTVHKV